MEKHILNRSLLQMAPPTTNPTQQPSSNAKVQVNEFSIFIFSLFFNFLFHRIFFYFLYLKKYICRLRYTKLATDIFKLGKYTLQFPINSIRQQKAKLFINTDFLWWKIECCCWEYFSSFLSRLQRQKYFDFYLNCVNFQLNSTFFIGKQISNDAMN